MTGDVRVAMNPSGKPLAVPGAVAGPRLARPRSRRGRGPGAKHRFGKPQEQVVAQPGGATRLPWRRVLLGSPRVELVTHEGLVADHPRLMPRLDEIRLASLDLLLCSVLVHDVHAA